MFAGVVSEKPPEISASREFQKLQHSGRVYKACSRVWFPKSRREFPRARDCRGSRTPVGCTRLVRGCSFRKAARNFRKPGIAAAPGPRPGVQGLSAGVVSEKPPGISASLELPRIQAPGRDFERVPRPPRPKSQQIFPRPLSSVVRLFCNNPTRKWSAYHF